MEVLQTSDVCNEMKIPCMTKKMGHGTRHYLISLYCANGVCLEPQELIVGKQLEKLESRFRTVESY